VILPESTVVPPATQLNRRHRFHRAAAKAPQRDERLPSSSLSMACRYGSMSPDGITAMCRMIVCASTIQKKGNTRNTDYLNLITTPTRNKI